MATSPRAAGFTGATTVPEGNVTVTPFSKVRAELVPQSVKGRFRGRPKLAVDILGNVKVTASISGSDNSHSRPPLS